jgi:tetratricopeptide (TPR) repeat protein
MGTTRFQEALDALVSGAATPSDALGLSPAIVRGMYALGRDALREERPRDAEALFLRCVQLDPRRATHWLALATAKQALGQIEEAGELFQFAAMYGDDAAPLAYAAACFAEVGQLDRARILADAAREGVEDPASIEPWLRVAEGRAGEGGAP